MKGGLDELKGGIPSWGGLDELKGGLDELKGGIPSWGGLDELKGGIPSVILLCGGPLGGLFGPLSFGFPYDVLISFSVKEVQL